MHTSAPKGSTPVGLSDEKAARILIGLRAGQTLRKFWVKPNRLEAYFEAHPGFACEARPLIEANSAAARLRKGERLRSQTRCKYGHSLADARISRRRTGYVMRSCRTCQSIRAKELKPLPIEQLFAVKTALLDGRSISDITGCRLQGVKRHRVVNSARFYNARKLDPEFDRFVLEAIIHSNSNAQKLRGARLRTHAATERQRAEANDYQKIRAMLPAYLPGRDDVAQDIFIALLEKSLRREDVAARVKWYITDHNRRFPTNFAKFGNSPLVSLDEQIFEDGTTTRGDTISRGLWD